MGVLDMMIMTIATYPMSSMYKTVEVFLDTMKKSPLPDYIETTGMYVRWGGKGLKVYTIYNIQDGKADQGTKDITSFEVGFSAVEGYRLKSEVVLPIEEALAIIGEKMP
jgi:hypothetical protein